LHKSHAGLLVFPQHAVREVSGGRTACHRLRKCARAEPAMSGGQRFFLAMMLFLNILVLGLLALLATGRLEIPLP